MSVRLLVPLLLAGSVLAQPNPPASPPHPLIWDAMQQTLEVKPGDGAADFEFHVTNKSEHAVEIVEIRPSCGCTVAEMPSTPWILEPGARSSFRGTIDFRGKHGRVAKSLGVISRPGTQLLGIVVNLPELDPRERNREMALHDRQAVFKGDCASCHAAPAQSKVGGELFAVACGICHLAEHRAAMVPNLSVAREPRDAEYWRKWILVGKEGTLMPGFGQKSGGPLTDEQVDSLVEFALAQLPTAPAKN
jgi:mono/diheme cytochrome c family protein